MATLYFHGGTDWNTAGNWWLDSGYTMPAGTPPSAGDTVYLESAVHTGPASAISLAALYLASANYAEIDDAGAGISTTGDLTVGSSPYINGFIYANLSIGGTAYFYASSSTWNVLTVMQQAVFYDNSLNEGTIAGDATFNDNSGSSGSTIEGNATFNGTSSNNSTIGGNATFNDSSYNNYKIVGNATFNDSSTNNNFATVEGNATFNGSSTNLAAIAGGAAFNGSSTNYGTVGGGATFRDQAQNNGDISGNTYVYYPAPRPLGGIVSPGTTTYYGYPFFYFNAAADNNWNTLSLGIDGTTFYNWWLDNQFTMPASYVPTNGDIIFVEGNVTTGPSPAVTLTALYIGQVNSEATLGDVGSGISTTGDLVVGCGIYTYGKVNGVSLTVGNAARFYGNGGGNCGTLMTSSAIFCLSSSNYGTSQGGSSDGNVTGNAAFFDNAKNYCSIGGTAAFNDLSSNNTGGDITGNAAFNDSSSNSTNVAAMNNATFKNSSSNTGLIYGNTSVYYPVGKPIGGTVSPGTITYYNYPP